MINGFLIMFIFSVYGIFKNGGFSNEGVLSIILFTISIFGILYQNLNRRIDNVINNRYHNNGRLENHDIRDYMKIAQD